MLQRVPQQTKGLSQRTAPFSSCQGFLLLSARIFCSIRKGGCKKRLHLAGKETSEYDGSAAPHPTGESHTPRGPAARLYLGRGGLPAPLFPPFGLLGSFSGAPFSPLPGRRPRAFMTDLCLLTLPMSFRTWCDIVTRWRITEACKRFLRNWRRVILRTACCGSTGRCGPAPFAPPAKSAP
jgi:hypothetical protein